MRELCGTSALKFALRGYPGGGTLVSGVFNCLLSTQRQLRTSVRLFGRLSSDIGALLAKICSLLAVHLLVTSTP